MPFIQTDHSFHYTEQSGVGRPIVMIHSTGIGSKQWSSYFKFIDSRPLLAIDLLGYSHSDSWNDRIPISADLEGAEELVLSQSEPVDIIGHSYGGFIAMQIAKRHPFAVNSMLLHEPVAWGSLFSSEKEHLKEEFNQICDLFFSQKDTTCDDWLNGFIDFWNWPGSWNQLPEKTKIIWREQFSKVYAEVSSLCLDRTPLSHWNSIKQPTWITISSDAPEPEKEVCRLLSQTMPKAKLLKHSGGHLSPITHFTNLRPFIKQWLER